MTQYGVARNGRVGIVKTRWRVYNPFPLYSQLVWVHTERVWSSGA